MPALRDGLATAALVLVLALAAWIYAPTLGHDFVSFDDGLYITDNPKVTRGLEPDSITWALHATTGGNWHPLTWLSHMADVELFGLDPGGHHLVGVLLHGVSSLLLFAALRRMTGARWTSLLVAGLFALHPLRVESVAWAAERKDVLCGLFWMLTLLAYSEYARRPGLLRYLAVTLSIAAALAAKPMAVTLPFVLLLLDFWPLERDRQSDDGSTRLSCVVEKLPWVALSAAAAWIAFRAQDASGTIATSAALALPARLANAALSATAYLSATFWPVGLSVYYPHPAEVDPQGLGRSGLLAAAVLLTITALVLWLGRRRRHLTCGWLWYLGTLVPVIGLVQVGQQGMADRYTYLPTVGIYIALAWELRAQVRARPALRWGVAVACVATLAVLALTAERQVGHWKNSRRLFEHALSVTEHNHVAHNSLGVALFEAGELDSAREHFEAALIIRPEHSRAHDNLANLLARQGDSAGARQHYARALAADPLNYKAHNNLGIMLYRAGDPSTAREHYERALALRPDYARAHNNLATLLSSLGDLEGARRHYLTAVEIDPGNERALGNLGNALVALGQLEAARAYLEQALAINPSYVTPRLGLGRIFEHRAELRNAAEHYRRALSAPSPPRLAACRLAWILATAPSDDLRNGAEAVSLGQRCVSDAASTDVAAFGILAAAYAEAGRRDEAVRWQTRVVGGTGGADQAIAERRLLQYREGTPHRAAGGR